MAPIKPVLNQFNGGEISPWLEGRIDLPKYQYSAKTIKDFIPMSEGSAKRRGGSHYVVPVKEVDAFLFKINPTPEDATVFINGLAVYEIYCALGDVVSYSVSCPKFQSVNETIVINNDTTLNVELLSLSLRNTITILPTPNDADVYINNVKQESAVVLKNSTVNYEVSKEGFDTYKGSVQVVDDISIEIKLTTSFSIVVDEAGAAVFINGQKRSSIVVNLGDKVEWSVSKSGFMPQSGNLIIDKSTVLMVDLKPYYDIDQIIINKNIGGSYSFTLKVDGYYRLSICGSGGGAGGSAGSHSWVGSNGGSGSAFSGKVRLSAGTHTVYVGKGGVGGVASGRNAPPGRAGEASYMNNGTLRLLTCGAGGGGSGTGDGYIAGGGGDGGILTFGSIAIQSYTVKSNGKKNSITSLLSNGSGCGGQSKAASTGSPGTDGSIKITYLGQV